MNDGELGHVRLIVIAIILAIAPSILTARVVAARVVASGLIASRVLAPRVRAPGVVAIVVIVLVILVVGIRVSAVLALALTLARAIAVAVIGPGTALVTRLVSRHGDGIWREKAALENQAAMDHREMPWTR